MNADHQKVTTALWEKIKVATLADSDDLWQNRPGRYYRASINTAANGDGRIPAIDAWLGRFPIKLTIADDGEPPAFNWVINTIRMPPFVDFKSSAIYYSTIFHELIHSTGPTLHRPSFVNSNSEGARLYEEIIAETGAAILSDYWAIDGTAKGASYIRFFLDHIGQSIRAESFNVCAQAASIAVDVLMAA